MPIQPIILSHRRAGTMTTHKHVANCKLCVPESQADDYARAYPDLELLPHSDSIVGIWRKRQWAWATFGEHVQLDDDLGAFARVYRGPGAWKKSGLSADRAYELIQQTAETARQLGAYLFGYGWQPRPMYYDGLRPIRFGGYTAGVLGLLEGGRFFWPDVELGDGDDYWICLLNAHYHRFAYLDRRFAIVSPPGHTVSSTDRVLTDAGGLEEFRSDKEAVEVEVLEFLQRHFGREAIVRNITPESGRRSIQIPYRH